MSARPEFFDEAMALARKAAAEDEVPVGAVVVHEGKIIGRGYNRREQDHDPISHAEIAAIREAARTLGSWRLLDCVLYVTLEPCPMCAAAISFARLRRLYYGAQDPKSGGVAHGARVFEQAQCHHAPEVYDGIGAEAAADVLRAFFAERR